MGLRRCAHCGDNSAWALRVLVGADIVAGLCLIVFGELLCGRWAFAARARVHSRVNECAPTRAVAYGRTV
jgi:hypothetical protein